MAKTILIHKKATVSSINQAARDLNMKCAGTAAVILVELGLRSPEFQKMRAQLKKPGPYSKT